MDAYRWLEKQMSSGQRQQIGQWIRRLEMLRSKAGTTKDPAITLPSA